MTEVKQQDGRFQLFEDGKQIGLMDYKMQGGGTMIITHTEVDKAYGGRGLGKKLVEAGVEFAREKQIKINPLCPYAKAVIDKNADWQDVLAE